MFHRHLVGHIAAPILFLCITLTVRADTNYTSWMRSPGVSDDWSAPQNWSNGVPTANSYANISNGGTVEMTQAESVCYHLELGNGNLQILDGTLTLSSVNGGESVGAGNNGSTGTITQSGGVNQITSFPAYLSLGRDPGCTGTYTLSGTGILKAAGGEMVGDTGTGYFFQSGGSNVCGNNLSLGGFSDWGGSGTYNLTNGSLYVGGDLAVGCYNGTGRFVQSGGTNTVDRGLIIGYGFGMSEWSNVKGTYLLTEGQLISSLGGEIVGHTGRGDFTQSGGTNTAGMLTLGLYSTGNGTYNLNGGVLIASAITAGLGGKAFNFGGGTLKASGAFSTTVPMTLTYISGNANVDTTDGNVTLAGILSGSGGLNKLGTGTLTLSAANTYGGDTIIDKGILRISQNIGSGLSDLGVVKIASDAFLDLKFSGTDIIRSLYLDGVGQAQTGTWGSIGSGAQHQDAHFTGTGLLNVMVAVPEPSTIALLLTATLGGVLLGRRRS